LSAELTKTHSFRLFFWPFCPLGFAYTYKISFTRKIEKSRRSMHKQML